MDILLQNIDTWLFTTIYPNRDKETVILLHGGPGVPNGLTFLRKYLSRYFQVITFHQRGTLRSPCTSHDYSLERYNADINRIADHFKLEKFHLFGHSWGGLYAQVYAQQFHNRLLSLFLCSPAPGTGSQWAEAMVEIANYNKKKTTVLEFAAMNVNSALGVLGSNKGYKNFYSQALLNFSRGFKEANPEDFAIYCIKARAINRTLKNILTFPLLSGMVSPEFRITITYGDQDIFSESMRYVVQRYPTAEFHFIPASGHIPWSHNQPEFVRILNDHYRIG